MVGIAHKGLVSFIYNELPQIDKKKTANTFFFNIYIYIFFNLFLAALGLRCCAQAFSSCSERGLLFLAVCGLLIVVASLAAEHRL